MVTWQRAAIAIALAGPLLVVSFFGLWAVGSGTDALDGVGFWDGSCFETDAEAGVAEIAVGVLVPLALWTALIAWIRRRRWWWRCVGLAAVGVAVAIVVVPSLEGVGGDLPYERCADQPGV